MLSQLIRKARQLQGDPVLRSWLIGRALGRLPGEPAFTPHRPTYLNGLLPLGPETPSHGFAELARTNPTGPIDLELAGETVRLEPGQQVGFFRRTFDDVESLLSLHRFAWLTDPTQSIDPAWVDALWREWLVDFSTPSDGWAWHPYTAAERANNILSFAHHHGLPGSADQTAATLAAHAPVIAERLEYFGDHHTSNHLANNGRGLLVLGIDLGLPQAADLGGKILVHEASRIFAPSGMLREGSSHYHLLYLRLYENAARIAEKAARPEADDLHRISTKARAAANRLMLPGGLPLIGDISPDLSPEALLASLDLAADDSLDPAAMDGWLRYQNGPWSGLWHAAPEGFSQMPGHGHNDCGSFELHYQDEPVLIDPGRGAYGEDGDAALYRSATLHNGLTVDGAEPFPPNRPYYDATFRRRVAGEPPKLTATDSGVTLTHRGFGRLAKLGSHGRSWRFDGSSMTLADRLEGRGRATVTRTLITPLAVRQDGDHIVLNGKRARYILRTEGAAVTIIPVTRWRAYGRGEPAHALVISSHTPLPFDGVITLEAD